MATFLSLTNELLRRMGEVQLDSTEFADAKNIQGLAKDAVNSAIRELMHTAQEWPFAIITYTQTLTSGTSVYSFQSDASSVDWDSFYLKRLTAKNNLPTRLDVISYKQYLDNHRPTEDQASTGGYDAPRLIYQTEELKFGVTPIPDDAYEVEYKYWQFPDDLSDATDVMIVPDRFRNVVLDGAMTYMMTYRSNEQSAAIHRDKFDQGIRSMRRLLLDDPLSMRSTMITRPITTSGRVANG